MAQDRKRNRKHLESPESLESGVERFLRNRRQSGSSLPDDSDAAAAIVVSVEYRPAPEHPFPAGLRDCYAATAWADRNAEAIGGTEGGVAVGGTSAGATLSACVSLMARDFAEVGESGVPEIAFQWLVYPAANVRETFDSYRGSRRRPSSRRSSTRSATRDGPTPSGFARRASR